MVLFLVVAASRAGWSAADPATGILGHYDLGLVQTGRVFQHEFALTNSGAAPLLITSVRSLCDCVQVASYPKTIAPHAAGNISVAAQPQQPGPLSSTVQVEIPGDNTFRVFMLTGWADDGAMARWTNLLVRAEDLISEAGARGRATFIDLRPAEKFRLGRIPGSLNLPLYTIKGRAFLRSKPLVLLGEGHDDRTLLAEAQRLRDIGFISVRVLEGGLRQWQQEGGVLAPFLHKGVEQAGGGSVSKLEKTDAYANNFHPPPCDRL